MSEFARGEHDFITTFSGGRVFPTNPRPEEVKIIDVCHSLSLKNRWCGHTRIPFSVLDHSLRVAEVARVLAEKAMIAEELLDEIELHALCHDFAEYILPDVCRPIKNAMAIMTNALGGVIRYVPFREFESHVQGVIYEGLGLPTPVPGTEHIIKAADNILLATEARDLCAGDEAGWAGMPMPPMRQTLTPRPNWEALQGVFHKNYQRLTEGLRAS